MSNLTENQELIVEMIEYLNTPSSMVKYFSGRSYEDKVDELINLRIENEIMAGKYLRYGMEMGLVTVERCIELMARSKDTLGELFKQKQLMGGRATEIVGEGSTMSEVEARLKALMFSKASDADVSETEDSISMEASVLPTAYDVLPTGSVSTNGGSSFTDGGGVKSDGVGVKGLNAGVVEGLNAGGVKDFVVGGSDVNP